jgi:hypothetical protein
VRKAALVALVLGSLVLAACGGSSGGSSSSESSGGSAEAAWAKEIQSVMTHFENHVSSRFVESISTSSSQHLLEPLYRAYAIHLAKLAKELEVTKAPAACVPVRKKLAADARRVTELNKGLGHQQDLGEDRFAILVEKQGRKLSKYGSELAELSAVPSC